MAHFEETGIIFFYEEIFSIFMFRRQFSLFMGNFAFSINGETIMMRKSGIFVVKHGR